MALRAVGLCHGVGPMGPLDLGFGEIVAELAQLLWGSRQQGLFLGGMRAVAQQAVTRLNGRMGNLLRLLDEVGMAAETEVAAPAGELEFLGCGVGVVAGGAFALLHRAVDARGLGNGRLFFVVAAIAQCAPLLAQELGELGRMWVVTAFAHSQLDRGMDVGLRKLLLEFGMALKAKLGPLRLQFHRGLCRCIQS